MSIIYYHNPSCSKSRAGLAFLEEKGVNANIRLYLEEPPSPQELEDILKKLNMKPLNILRSKEAGEAGINKDMNVATIVNLLSQNPKALQRPILIINDKAIIGRPTENIAKFIEDML